MIETGGEVIALAIEPSLPLQKIKEEQPVKNDLSFGASIVSRETTVGMQLFGERFACATEICEEFLV